MAIEMIGFSSVTNTLGVKSSKSGSEAMTAQEAAPSAEVAGGSNAPARTVDLRNITLREINTLIKAGVGSLLDIVPHTATINIGKGLDMDQPIDYLGNVEKFLEYERSTGGKQTQFFENLLGRLNQVQGMPFPGVDIVV